MKTISMLVMVMFLMLAALSFAGRVQAQQTPQRPTGADRGEMNGVVASTDPRSLVANLHKQVQTGRMPLEEFETHFKDVMKRLFNEQNGRRGEYDTGVPGFVLRKGAGTPTGILKAKAYRGEPELVTDFRRLSDDFLLIKAIMGKNFEKAAYFGSKHGKEFMAVSTALLKALDTGTAGSGLEWIPNEFSSQLQDRIKLKLMVAANHDRIAMPTKQYTLPTRGGDPVAYLTPESASDSAAKISALTPSTGSKAFNAKGLAARILVSREMEVDSIVPVLNLVREDLATAIANAEERAIIDGDVTATHMDSDVTVGTDARKAWPGLRKLAPAASKVDAANAVATDTLVRNVVEKMEKYSVVPGDVYILCGVKGYHQLLKTANFLTVDKYGASATILTGELGKFDGKPVIVSEWVRKDLNALGVHDGVTTNRTVIHVVNRRPLLIGDREHITVEADKDIETQQEIMVGFAREDFINRLGASEPCIGTLYNIA